MRPLLSLALWALVLVVPLRSGAAAPAPTEDFEFEQLNRAYRDFPVTADPIEKGPFRIQLSSARHDFLLLRHRLRLQPQGDGTHEAELWAQFHGSGDLSADVTAAGLGHQFRDRVSFPTQAQTLRGRVKIERAKDGFRITTLALPRRVTLQLQSRLGGEILGWCERLASLPLSPLECSGLDRALTPAAIPLPPPGETYLLANTDLTAENRRRLDAYLSSSVPGPATQKPGLTK